MNAVIERTSGRRTARGFTLIELLVTLAVIAILISIGVPMYGNFTQGAAVATYSSELTAALHLARAEAVSQRTNMQLAALSGTGTWTTGWQINNVSTVPPTLVRTVPLTESTVTVMETNDRPALVFDREGRVMAVAGGVFVDAAFTVCPPSPAAVGAGRRITLSRLGRIQVAASAAADCL